MQTTKKVIFRSLQFQFYEQVLAQAAQSNEQNPSEEPMLSSIMSQIISDSEQRPGNESAETDQIRISAKKALGQYLALPLSPSDTFSFWKSYSLTTDQAQLSLCKLARLHLTPPPTSTDTERWGPSYKIKVWIVNNGNAGNDNTNIVISLFEFSYHAGNDG